MYQRNESVLRLGVLATALGGAAGGVCFGLLVAAGMEHVVARWDAAAGREAVAESVGSGEGWDGAAGGIAARLVTMVHVVGPVLGAVTALALLGWVMSAGRQRRAVAAVRGLGGEVVYGDGLLPRRWRGTFAADYFASVVSVHLEGTEVGDGDLVWLGGFPRLRRLWLGGAAISDAALEYVGRLRRLESLNLSGTGVSDAGVEQLMRLKCLRRLWLVGTEVSEAGVETLRGLRRLELVERDVEVEAGMASLG